MSSEDCFFTFLISGEVVHRDGKGGSTFTRMENLL
jgi:hypothetical protein